MPLHLDKNDISILKSLLKDGRKSFRQISRETGITTPTVKARFERLVNVGFIKGVIPIFDFKKISNKENIIQIQGTDQKAEDEENQDRYENVLEEEIESIEGKIKSGLAISLTCDYCQGLIHGKPKVLKFADIERFFCCSSCKTDYSEKYRGRIESIKRRYEGKSEIDI